MVEKTTILIHLFGENSNFILKNNLFNLCKNKYYSSLDAVSLVVLLLLTDCPSKRREIEKKKLWKREKFTVLSLVHKYYKISVKLDKLCVSVLIHAQAHPKSATSYIEGPWSLLKIIMTFDIINEGLSQKSCMQAA